MGKFRYPFQSRIPGVPDPLVTALGSNFREAETMAGAQAKVDAYATTASGLYIPKSLLTAKGQLVGASASGAPVAIPAAAGDGYGLVSDTSQAGGMAWIGANACRVYHNSSGAIMSVAAGGNAKGPIPFTSEDFDPAGMHDNSTNNGRITLNKTGIWLVGYNVPFLVSSGYTGGTDLAVYVIRNGTWSGGAYSTGTIEWEHFHDIPAGGTSILPQISGSTVISATANDYIELAAYSDVTGTNVQNAGTGKFRLNFWACYMGANA